jgi:mannose-6-phosphate isomerase-like protein (cupin superfamily)
MQEKCEISRKIFVKEVSDRGNGKSFTASAATNRGEPASCRVIHVDLSFRNRFGGGPMRLPFLVVLAFSLTVVFTAQPTCAQNAFTPDQVKWGPAPPFLPPGAQLAVLEGDPMASSGDFTIRLKMPDGYKVAPHTHPHRENVTVLSGTLKVGMGDQFDAGKMMSFGSGSFAYLDPSMHHYAAASGETVIQIHGMSPVKFNYINPADDPSMKK